MADVPIDLNADAAEGQGAADEAILPLITSADELHEQLAAVAGSLPGSMS